MTIKDISRETGYSIGTISRVLNNHPNVSEQARKTIMEVVEKRGFVLNASAKSLKQQSSANIIVIVKGTSNELFANLVEQIQLNFMHTKYNVIVEYIDEEGNEVERARQISYDKKPQGFLFLGGNMENFVKEFSKLDLPSVLVTNSGRGLGFGNLSSVTTDDQAAARCAVDYLLSQGHKKVALLGGYAGSDVGRSRRQGWIEAHAHHNIEEKDMAPFVEGRFSFKAGYQGMEKLLDSGEKITAVFAVADVMAVGAISAITDRGLKVPEDISVLGFDGLELGEYVCPKLTTIVQDVELIAKRSCKLLRDYIEEKGTAKHEMVGFSLKCRQSVKYLGQ